MPTFASRRFRPTLERLERREVPATITTDLRGGVLTAVGTDFNDTIVVTRIGAYMRVTGRTVQNGVATTYAKNFTASAVGSIVLAGEGGNDSITVASFLTQPARV